jgi:hypothetical protein
MEPDAPPGLFANGWAEGMLPDPSLEEQAAHPAAKIIQLPTHRFIDHRFMAGDGP